MTVGRPSEYSQETADKICERLASGESLKGVCKRPDMPGRTTVYEWLFKNPEFADKYARATELRAEYEFDNMFEIADTPQMGVKTVTKPDGSVETTQGDMIEHRRLRIDARKWALARMAPRKYGDRTFNENESNVNLRVGKTITEDMTPAEAAEAFGMTLRGER
jgi:hypothetical protein